MAASAWNQDIHSHNNLFGFIAVGEHARLGCMIVEFNDLGVCLITDDPQAVPSEFVLYSYSLDKAQSCKLIWRTNDMVGAWLDG